MPSWAIHDKWALRLGINRRISREINLLIDFPEKWFKQKYSDEEVEAHGLYDVVQVATHLEPTEPCIAFFKLSKFSGRFGHDMGRKRKWQRDFQLHCVYKHYGIQGVKAAILHHMLDYIERIAYFGEEEILRRIDERFGDLVYYANYRYSKEWHHVVSKAASEVLEFVRQNISDIVNDLTVQPSYR